MFSNYLEVEKKWFLAISSLTNTVAAIWREKRSGSLLFGGSQPAGARKKCFPAIWKRKKMVPSYFEPDQHCCSYLEK